MPESDSDRTATRPADQAPRFSIVIPCHNEQDNIAVLLQELDGALAQREDAEIIVVDDCSTDATKARVREVRAALGVPVRLIVHAHNRGQSAALCTAIDAALGEWIVTMDGDGQNPPGDVALFLSWVEGAAFDPAVTMVCGHRRTRRDPWVRRASSSVANGVRARLLRDATPDTGCGLKLLRRETFMRLPRFDHMHRFLPALVGRIGGSVVSVTVGHRPRLHGRSKYGIHNRLWVGITDLFGVMWLQRRAFRISDNEEL